VRVLSLLGSLLFLGVVASNPPMAAVAAAQNLPSAAANSGSGAAAPPTLAPMLARVSPAVVNISVQGTARASQNELLQDPFFRRFFGLPENPSPDKAPVERFQAMGSGVIFDAKFGYVITNNHVVDRADKIQVVLTDRRQLEAKLVAADPQTDIAVLKVEPERLTSLPMGDSKQVQVGDYVVALGNPFGVGQTATFGIVSGLGRTGLGIENYEDFIQTDASINPGNSGGALVDMEGRLIGMNAAIISRGGGNVGIGFAIPINMVKSVAQQLILQGRVSRGALGVTVQDLTPSLAKAMQIDVFGGALVSQVNPKSAAAKAGIEDGDVIVALDGDPVTTSSQLRNAIGQKQPGTTVRVSLLRNGRERSVTATLDPLAPAAVAQSAKPQENSPLAGMTFGAIPRNDPNYGKVSGVYVASVEPCSSADEAGLKQGDIIMRADRTPVSTPAELTRMMRDRKQASPVLLQVRRGDASVFIALG
jgi:serine protease DegQ